MAVGGQQGTGRARIVKHAHPRASRAERFDIRGMAEFNGVGDGLPADPEQLRAAILEAAREEAALKVQEAYQEGYRRGFAAGGEAFAASIGRCEEALALAIEEVQRVRTAYLDAIESQVLELTRLIAERVVHREWRSDPETIRRMARLALERITDRQRLTVRLHPDDVLAFREHQVTLLETFPGVEEMHIVGDEAITPGGCLVDSGLMQADARLETLLGRVLDALDE